jgi:hypothetical protein
MVDAFFYSNQPLSHVGGTTDYVLVMTGMPEMLASKSRMQTAVALKETFGPGVTEDEQSANGLTLLTLGPQCVYGQCSAVKVVFGRQVIWMLRAVSNGPANIVQSFVASFQPIG